MITGLVCTGWNVKVELTPVEVRELIDEISNWQSRIGQEIHFPGPLVKLRAALLVAEGHLNDDDD